MINELNILLAIIFILTEMNKTKSTTQSGHSTTKPIFISTHTKFEKLDQVNHMVHEISQKQHAKQQQKLEKMVMNTRQIKLGTSQKVLELLKTRIKTNYDQLYNNYGDNKQKIIKQIQAVETNIAGQNAMNTKFDDIIKQKAKYDKLKAEVQNKQKKLKKYSDLKQQLLNESTFKIQKDESSNIIIQKFGALEEKKMEIQHQSAILKEMLKNRKKIHLTLLQKYNRLYEENMKKVQRKNKIAIQNLKKQKMIKGLQQKLMKEDQIDIPTRLAQQLSQKIEMYQNKHSYNTIIEHEAILQEERYKKLKEDVQNQRQLQRQKTKKREVQQKNQLEELYNIYLIKNMELQKIKKLCAADSIEAIIGSDGSLDAKNLEEIKIQIEKKIQEQQAKTKSLQNKIEAQMNHQDVVSSKNAQNLLLQVEQQKKKLMLLNLQCHKKEQLSNKWLIILDLLKVKSTSEDLQHFLTSLQTQYIRTQGNSKNAHNTKTKLMNQMIEEYDNEQTS